MNNEILNSLESLFEKAEHHKLWFFTHYQQLWFSPKELREQHKQDKFVWGRENWELRDPHNLESYLVKDITKLQLELESVRERIKKG